MNKIMESNMSVKKINIIYLYPLKFENGKSKCFNLSPILKGLKALPVDERRKCSIKKD